VAHAQTPEGSPEASPIALPTGPLGDQLAWLLQALNYAPLEQPALSADEVAQHLDASFEGTADEVTVLITGLGAIGGPWIYDTSSMITTRDFPPSHAGFTIIGAADGMLQGGLTVNAGSGLISALELGYSTVVPADYPAGPIGEQLWWLQTVLNTEDDVTVDEVATHLAAEPAEGVTAESVADLINTRKADGGPWQIDLKTAIMTMDFPPSNISFDVIGEGGVVLRGGISIDHGSGLIRGFGLEITSEGTPVA
jgi:hypothetical protein